MDGKYQSSIKSTDRKLMRQSVLNIFETGRENLHATGIAYCRFMAFLTEY